MLSKTQADRLGERLKTRVTAHDIELLNEYRDSFRDAYSTVGSTIRSVTGGEPSGRAAKSIPSIVAKLSRETTRLSQMQDIAGFRLLVADLAEQDRVALRLSDSFEQVTLADRRLEPSHGYRAIHLVVTVDGKLVEIQIRTKLQHEWAELSEMYSDFFPGLKYGEGDADAYKTLLELSEFVQMQESLVSDLREADDDEERDTLVAAVHRGRELLTRYVELLKEKLRERGN